MDCRAVARWVVPVDGPQQRLHSAQGTRAGSMLPAGRAPIWSESSTRNLPKCTLRRGSPVLSGPSGFAVVPCPAGARETAGTRRWARPTRRYLGVGCPAHRGRPVRRPTGSPCPRRAPRHRRPNDPDAHRDAWSMASDLWRLRRPVHVETPLHSGACFTGRPSMPTRIEQRSLDRQSLWRSLSKGVR